MKERELAFLSFTLILILTIVSVLVSIAKAPNIPMGVMAGYFIGAFTAPLVVYLARKI